ncbi:MAG: 16S rRNA (guanine(966)-N(2))-methyltransferase RsmD [Lachnospiraceae bacterium]|nr:16S rRNA (guanine(966)-N(2))-methyltransferase RsmD [Lachnospiraceae bacterium]
MRIIAGSRRSLPLKTIAGTDTRPTTDRIKETLFNMLQEEVAGSYVLDLYAGSGQIGLEALSRGASYAVFVENAKKAADCIADNIRFTKFEEQTNLMRTDAISAIARLEGRNRFDLIFLDPPYESGAEVQALTCLSGSSVMKPETLIIVEAARDTDFSYAEGLGLTLVRQKQYKTNQHVFFRKKEA